MKYCVALDGDGHFQLAKLDDRPAVIKILKNISDGDYWADMAEDYMESVGAETESDLLTIDEPNWKEFVIDFEQRGMMEIKSIK